MTEPANAFRGTLRDVWARVRTRAKVEDGAVVVNTPTDVTDSDVAAVAEAVGRLARARAAVGTDARSWWLLADQPPSLADWFASNKVEVAQVPDGNAALRVGWIVDSWVVGSLFVAASVALFLAGAGLRWASRHPLRRWSVIVTAAATVAAFLTM